MEYNGKNKIVTLCGGVGGAKMALGLYRCLKERGRANDLAIIGNTGDDLDMFGLHVCPDLDTVLYTLSGLSNPQQGWGIADDTYRVLDLFKRYGEDTWFLLGDQDFATHILRTRMLKEGVSLTEITATLTVALGLDCALLPMSDSSVRTYVETLEVGEIPFQEYFVRRHAADTVVGIRYDGIEQAEITAPIAAAIWQSELVIIAPSNPYLSIEPILQVKGMEQALLQCNSPVVVVSPIVGGKALKGPAADIMRSFDGVEPSALGVAKYYKDLVGGFVLDVTDDNLAEEIAAMGYQVLVTQTVMQTDEDKQLLAEHILEEFLPR
ncbi:2-phospho-L-lactate transferase [Candidatus Chlorohelix sp.]|uniref:2-phospho-L-lactate transferase n=1 Tax=Candidatus Chlorohelix sp. TaxID=3139201 RepID=UPI0030251B16